jgi:hypothetical protein
MSESTAEKVGEWLVYIVVALAVILLFWYVDWSTLIWIAVGLVAAGLLLRFLLRKAK